MENQAPRNAIGDLRRNGRLVLYALLLSTGCFTYGYDSAVISGVLAMPVFVEQFGTLTPEGYMLTAHTQSVIVATATTGCLLGALINSVCADRYGRKNTIWGGCAISVVASVLQTASVNVPMITVSRVLTGVSVFVLIGIAVTFQTEISTPATRGCLSALSVISLELAAVTAAGVNWSTHNFKSTLSWRLPIGLQILLPLIIAFCTAFVMDSPTAYLIKSDDVNAERSLRKLRKGYSDAEIELEMAQLMEQQGLREAEKNMPWTSIFQGTNLRRTALATYVGCTISLSGLVFATSYATVFLEEAGETRPYLLVFILNILTLVGAVTGGALLDLIGRRSLALITFTAIFIIDCIIGGLGFAPEGNLAVEKAIAAFALTFGFFVCAGFGVLGYINTAEIPTARLRNKTNAYALLSNFLTSLTVAFVAPYLSSPDAGNLGAKTYLIFAGFMLLNLIYTYFCFPELKGRSPAEIDMMFEAKLPARAFKSYVCPLQLATQTQVQVPKNELE